jgi:hypothetical protein
MTFINTKIRVKNRGVPPDTFLSQIVVWGKSAAEEIFVPRKDDPEETDIYTSIKLELGPWQSLLHRRAAMLEVMRVLAGFESSWKWNEGVDITNKSSLNDIKHEEAGAWQVSFDSRVFGQDLRDVSPATPELFIVEMKRDHALACEYIARLLRHTIRHNGPAKRKEINAWLSPASVSEFQDLLS